MRRLGAWLAVAAACLALVGCGATANIDTGGDPGAGDNPVSGGEPALAYASAASEEAYVIDADGAVVARPSAPSVSGVAYGLDGNLWLASGRYGDVASRESTTGCDVWLGNGLEAALTWRTAFEELKAGDWIESDQTSAGGLLCPLRPDEDGDIVAPWGDILVWLTADEEGAVEYGVTEDYDSSGSSDVRWGTSWNGSRLRIDSPEVDMSTITLVSPEGNEAVVWPGMAGVWVDDAQLGSEGKLLFVLAGPMCTTCSKSIYRVDLDGGGEPVQLVKPTDYESGAMSIAVPPGPSPVTGIAIDPSASADAGTDTDGQGDGSSEYVPPAGDSSGGDTSSEQTSIDFCKPLITLDEGLPSLGLDDAGEYQVYVLQPLDGQRVIDCDTALGFARAYIGSGEVPTGYEAWAPGGRTVRFSMGDKQVFQITRQ